MKGGGSMSVGVVVALVALILVYQKLVVGDSGSESEIEQAVAALDSDGAEDRERAHEVLLAAEADSVAALLEALGNQAARRPEEIIKALADIGDDQAIRGLRAVLTSHPDAQARCSAAAALAEMADRDAVPLLAQRIDDDPALQVRQAALVALANLGDESVLRDLATLLDLSTVAELREAADDALEAITDQDFAGDRAAAEAWLDGHEAPPAKSVVAGVGAEPGEPLLCTGDTSVRIERQGASLHFEVTGQLALPMNLLLQLEQSRIVVELTQEDQQVTAGCVDAPATGRHLRRHAPITVEATSDALRFSIPRVGQLVSKDLPRAITVISAQR